MPFLDTVQWFKHTFKSDFPSPVILTLALSPTVSLPWCLTVSNPGTASQEDVTNSSTTPYCITSLRFTTFHRAADTRRTGGASSWRAAKGRLASAQETKIDYSTESHLHELLTVEVGNGGINHHTSSLNVTLTASLWFSGGHSTEQVQKETGSKVDVSLATRRASNRTELQNSTGTNTEC